MNKNPSFQKSIADANLLYEVHFSTLQYSLLMIIFCPTQRLFDKHIAVYTLDSDLSVWGGAGPGQQHRAAGPGAGVHEVRASLPLSDQRRDTQRAQLHGADGDRAGEPGTEATGSGPFQHVGSEHGVLSTPGRASRRSGGGTRGLGCAAPPTGKRHGPRPPWNSSL